MKIKKAVLKFKLADQLPLSYGYKLRGFFAKRFENILFHNHHQDGGYRYAYPLIQYKIYQGQPTVIGLAKGAELLSQNFLEIDKLTLGQRLYVDPEKELQVIAEKLKVLSKIDQLKYRYRFFSPWLALNQENYRFYSAEIQDSCLAQQQQFLAKILIGNILSFAKGVDWWVEEEIKVVSQLEEVEVNFKGQLMIGFIGYFQTNIFLPEYIGLGKSSARGFGTIIEAKKD
ncbi:CRISPR-associated endonuclease Cas6 [Fuchsiella alkaliacetigena]|uniref:CRISPR-associated endonuclease Cas6 n=1 Tax=Fuchsiella alkaliacetigena TaxID=957042 RepID=UPI00200B642A|nr:CRISPR-associated endonuclease Cas6 [Fuchsiella alkaliacetigena]MCK8823785.1 hypothetical protein [Fuchsiella alkaliacetigena]